MAYGESYGTSTLAKALRDLATDIYADVDDGVPWEEIREEAKNLVEGAMELWERMVEG